jgi:hypothetical protein
MSDEEPPPGASLGTRTVALVSVAVGLISGVPISLALGRTRLALISGVPASIAGAWLGLRLAEAVARPIANPSRRVPILAWGAFVGAVLLDLCSWGAALTAGLD